MRVGQLFLKIWRARWTERVLCVILLAAFVAALVPLLRLAAYDAPATDDFSYSAVSHLAWKETRSLGAVLKAACMQVRKSYQIWQGTFAAVFLMALQPAIFGERFYALTPYIMLGALTLSTLFFAWALFHRTLGCGRARTGVFALVWLLLCIEMPTTDAAQGFYWYNGAVFYTFFYAVSLVLLGLALLYLRAKGGARRGVYLALMCLCGALVGGGNYTTALFTWLLGALALALLVWKKNPRWKGLLLPFVTLSAALAVSMIAPGNAVRGAYLKQLGPAMSIVKSLYFGFASVGNWLEFPVVLMFVFLCPILWKMAGRARCAFRCPLLVAALSFCLFSAQYCPPLYAMGFTGPYRLVNLIYFSYLFLVPFNLFYLMGWLQRRYAITRRDTAAPRPRRSGYPALAVCFLLFATLCSCITGKLFAQLTSISAARSLANGEARAYAQVTRARLAILEDDAQAVAVLPDYKIYPALLTFSDPGNGEENWRNTAMARYYGKESVTVE